MNSDRPPGPVLPRRAHSEVLTLAAPAIPIASGDLVGGRYRIHELYGAGPLGFTFRAQDRDERWMAVKVLHPALVPTERERIAALTELEKLSQHTLRKTSLPRDAGTQGKFAYVVSAWVPGRSLRRVLGAYRDADIQLAPGDVYGLLAGVSEALQELHTVCIHGAVYPENIQVSLEGQVHLTDAAVVASLARSRWLEQLEYFPDVQPYMSREIEDSRPMTASADLWSVGVLASELLTGHPASLREGIAPAMLHGWPDEVAMALADLVGATISKRAAALPALLNTLQNATGNRTLPRAGSLPTQRARTELVQGHVVAPNEARSPGASLLAQRLRKPE
ncbi:MAG: protein kinase [Deltaproteobacteria bacterium]|nr:protein kinase [Deltaproteobacteria bacterium]